MAVSKQRATGSHEVRSVLGTVRSLVGRHSVLVFFSLAYLVAWSWWVPLALRGDVVRAGVGWPTHIPGLVAPAVAAVLVTAAAEGRGGLRDLGRRVLRWRVGWLWWLVVVVTFGLAAIGVVTAVVTGDELPSLTGFTRFTGIGSFTPVAVIAMVLVLNGLGEETGWRGFAVDRLLRDHDLRWTALAVGLGWAAWHLPLFWVVDTYRSFGPLALGWFISILAASVVLAYMYCAGRRSILLVAAWHTAFNFTTATEATGAVVGAVVSVVVISWAIWVLHGRVPDGAGPVR